MNVAERQKGGPNVVRRKKKERRKGWRRERKTNAKVKKEKRTDGEGRGEEEFKQSALRAVNEDERWGNQSK